MEVANPKRRSHIRQCRTPAMILLLFALFHFYTFYNDQYFVFNRTVKIGIKAPSDIPNITHFVRQLTRFPNSSAKTLKFEFRHFLAYYSAYHYLKPEEINIWSDVDDEMVQEAKLNGDIYTKAVVSLPGLHFRHVDMPNVTNYHWFSR